MAEVTFARNFLATLDSKPIKFSADHVEDPKNYPSRGAYILPKMPKPMSKSKVTAPGQEGNITVILRSVRNPPLDIKLSPQLPTTSVYQVKSAISETTSIPCAKIKVLYKNKPVADSKVLGDLLGDHATAAELEFSVMIIGAAAAAGPASGTGSKEDATTARGAAALSTEGFWQDLKSFLMLRVKDEQVAEQTAQLFREAWQARQ